MFERYTEKARRTIFFARYEASQFGSPYIESEHLLLGLLREDKALTNRFLRSHASVEMIRKQIEDHTVVREKVSTSVDLPLSNECRRVLAYAAEEAEILAHKHIGTEHLLLGLLREEKCFATQILQERGLRLAIVREELRRASPGTETRRAPAGEAPLAQFSTDITEQAVTGVLPAVLGRESELQRLIQVLGRATKSNAVLVGERGVGKRSIVAALAQHIAHGDVPPFIVQRRIVELDLASMVSARRAATLDFPGQAVAELMSSGDIIYFVPELESVLLAPPAKSWLSAIELFKTALADGKIQCISAATPEEHRRGNEKFSWLSRCFSDIEVAPPTEAEAVKILVAVRERFEKHHAVSYSRDAIEAAVTYSTLYVKNRALPDKALDLMDEAGAYVRSQVSALPEEILELRKKIRFTINRMENAIANHEFEKARFFSDEERKERDELRQLESKHGIKEGQALPVTREAVEEVVASWTGIPVEKIRSGTGDAPGSERMSQ